MNTLKSLLLSPFSMEPFLKTWRSLFLRNRIVVLMYHEVLEDSYSGTAWTVVKESEFEKHLIYLNKNYEIVSLKKALSTMKRQAHNSTPQVLLTFDDGYSGNKRVVLPIIERLKVPITIFVATKAIQEQQPYWYDTIINRLDSITSDTIYLDLSRFGLGLRIYKKELLGERRWNKIHRLLTDLKLKLPEERLEIVESICKQTSTLYEDCTSPIVPMTIEDITTLAASPFVTIGAHSHTHDILVQITAKEIFSNIVTSQKLLSEWTGKSVDCFSYPNGNYNKDVINILEDLNFICGMTTQDCLWKHSDSCFEIPRLGIGRYDSFEFFKRKVSGFLA